MVPVKYVPTSITTIRVGGRSIGCNTAYHLTKLGMSDVVVLIRMPAKGSLKPLFDPGMEKIRC